MHDILGDAAARRCVVPANFVSVDSRFCALGITYLGSVVMMKLLPSFIFVWRGFTDSGFPGRYLELTQFLSSLPSHVLISRVANDEKVDTKKLLHLNCFKIYDTTGALNE